MGTYTDHWEQQKQRAARCTLQALGLIGVGLPSVALLGYLLSPLSNVDTAIVFVFITALLVGVTVLVVRGSRVDCPRCEARYTRGKYLVNCPHCGLRMLQEEP